MDTGQMMALMQQVPSSAFASPAVESVMPVNLTGGRFAGLLQGVSMQKTGQTVMPVMSEAMTANVMPSDAMTALMAIAGNGAKLVIPVQADTDEGKSLRTTLEENSVPESQNVMMDVDTTQLGLLLAQLSGRMPEVSAMPGSQTKNSSDAPQSVVTTSATAAPVRLEEPKRTGDITAVPLQTADLPAKVEGKGASVLSLVGAKISETPQNEAVVTERDTRPVLKSTESLRPADATAPSATDRHIGRSEISFVPARDALRVVTDVPQQNNAVVLQPQITPGLAVPVLASAAESSVDTAVTENNVRQAEQLPVQSRLAAAAPAPAAITPVVVSVQEADIAEAPVAVTALQAQAGNVRSAASTAIRTAAGVETTDGKVETAGIRLDPREAGRNQQNSQVDTAKTIAAVPSGEKAASSDQQETPDRGMNGHFPSQVLQPQVKAEGALTASSALGAAQNDTPRTVDQPEPFVQQVRDRFVNHETKPGSEQIVLRLSPEHLGELKVNLNLEGQRLRVEIVAENRMVRDSLMQHTDALKESLSRQNINMDSFEVTTSGTTSADSGRSQNDWRELAQQRQHNAWIPHGGYRPAQQIAPAVAAYQAKSEHTMVDLHF